MQPNERCAASRQRRTCRFRLVRRQGGGSTSRRRPSCRRLPRSMIRAPSSGTLRRGPVSAKSSRNFCSGSTNGALWSARERTRMAVRSRLRTRRCFANGRGLRAGSNLSGRGWRRCALLQVDASTWDRNGREAAFVNHRDKRLAEATTLAAIDGYRKRLSAVEFDYLAVCKAAERLAHRRTWRVRVVIYVLMLRHHRRTHWLDQSGGTSRSSGAGTRSCRPFIAGGGSALCARRSEAERALKPKDSFRECAVEWARTTARR